MSTSDFTILCANRRPRSHGTPIWGVVHVNVGPEIEGGAVSLARYQADPTRNKKKGGYHQITDHEVQVRTAMDDEEVNGGGENGNNYGKHFCLIGQANQTAAQWADPYSNAELVLLSKDLAEDCRTFGWEPVRLTKQELQAKKRLGICGHVDLRDAFPADTDHWDPGPHFPWPLLLDLVRQQLNLAIPPGGGSSDMKATDKVDGYAVAGGGTVICQADGGVFANGGAPFFGSLPGIGVKVVLGVNHAVSLLRSKTGQGYWILGADGGIFSFGDAPYKGNGVGLASFGCQAVEIQPNGDGYSIVWASLVSPATGVIDLP